MPNMIDLGSTGLRRSAKLANKTRQKDGLFSKFSLSLIRACAVANNPHIFITISNQHIQEIIRHLDGNLNDHGPMLFAANQEQS